MNKQFIEEGSLSALVSSLQRHFVQLLDAEKRLALQEMSGKFLAVKKEALRLAAGAAVAAVVGLCLVAATILALSLIVAAWVAALLLAGAFGILTAGFVLVFRSKVR